MKGIVDMDKKLKISIGIVVVLIIVLAVIVGVISAVTISGYFFLRKRRNEK